MCSWCRSREEQIDAGADTAHPGERERIVNDDQRHTIHRKVSSPYLPQYPYRRLVSIDPEARSTYSIAEGQVVEPDLEE